MHLTARDCARKSYCEEVPELRNVGRGKPLDPKAMARADGDDLEVQALSTTWHKMQASRLPREVQCEISTGDCSGEGRRGVEGARVDVGVWERKQLACACCGGRGKTGQAGCNYCFEGELVTLYDS